MKEDIYFMSEQFTKKQKVTLATYPIAVFLFFAFLLSMSIFVHNINTQSVDDEDDNEVKVETEEKKQQLRAVLSKGNHTLPIATYQPVKKDDFTRLVVENTHAGIVFDAHSGTILWEKNSTDKRSIASITKLVTAMVVVDRVRDLDELVTIPESVMNIEGTKVGCSTSVICNSEKLQVGEQISLRNLLQAMLMFSANDAATVLALHIGGSEEGFAKLMNARMKEIGASNTNFCRPSGLELDEDVESCYSSAYDIARVISHLVRHDKYDILWNMMRTKEAVVASADGSLEHELKNTNRLVDEMSNLVGAKTGFTPRAGYCLALTSTSANKKHDVISIVLDDYHRFDDVQEMSEWAFNNYTWQ